MHAGIRPEASSSIRCHSAGAVGSIFTGPNILPVLRLLKPLPRHVELATHGLGFLELRAGPFILRGKIVPGDGGRDALRDGLIVDRFLEEPGESGAGIYDWRFTIYEAAGGFAGGSCFLLPGLDLGQGLNGDRSGGLDSGVFPQAGGPGVRSNRAALGFVFEMPLGFLGQPPAEGIDKLLRVGDRAGHPTVAHLPLLVPAALIDRLLDAADVLVVSDGGEARFP